ncbi:MAG: hypothetical protein SF172_05595, partial [Burkholderiales bacterium]|nr:hypothetical protein [Burkholderiales bacterium]
MTARHRVPRLLLGVLFTYSAIFFLAIPARFSESIRVKQVSGWIDYLFYESWMSRLSESNPIRIARESYIDLSCRKVQVECTGMIEDAHPH